eukprot:6491556-Amphidinium_carterae.1
MEPPNKAIKLHSVQSLRASLPHISQNALAAILKAAAENPLPTGSRTTIREARDLHAKQETPYGSLHSYIDCPLDEPVGATMRLEVQNPMSMLFYLCLNSHSFGAMVQKTHAENPSTPEKPWNMILYSDEISPGNQLS